MSSTGTIYHISVFPCGQKGGAPSAEVHIELGDWGKDVATFYPLAQEWIECFDNFHKKSKEPRCRVRVSDGRDLQDHPLYCSEEEIITALLYACRLYQVTALEIRCKGQEYTEAVVTDYEEVGGSFGCTLDAIRLEAKVNGRPGQVYVLGPYIQDIMDQKLMVEFYPESCGIVEALDGQIYLGTYGCDQWVDLDWDEFPDMRSCYSEDVHAFFQQEGEELTFSVVMGGKLYRKLTRRKDGVVFYHTPPDRESGRFERVEQREEALVNASGFRQGEDPKDICFVWEDGTWRYAPRGESPFRGVTFVPPEAGEITDRAAARQLLEEYVRALYAAFSHAEEYRLKDWTFRRRTSSSPLCLETEGFRLNVAFVPPPDIRTSFDEGCYPVSEEQLQVTGVSFSKGSAEVMLIPRTEDRSRLDIILADGKGEMWHGTFDGLNKCGFFSKVDLPKTIRFRRSFRLFMGSLGIYKSIRQAILEHSMLRFRRDLTGIGPELSREDMRELLYNSDEIPDQDLITLALELQRRFQRTGRIPNLALIGQAGTGKSSRAGRLAAMFGRGIMINSPSDLKAPYVGQTKYEVVVRLAEAAKEEQIFFIDEAYTLMSDQFGREAVSLLLPLMTGDRNRRKLEARLHDNGIAVDFEAGQVTTYHSGEVMETSAIPPRVPPIWIAGYEDDIRLMMHGNQGLFRRFRSVVLKPPSTNELYQELLAKTRTQAAGEDGELAAKYGILLEQFLGCETLILKFFRWGAQPQNSRYFGNHAGVNAFLDRCIDGLDFSQPGHELRSQIEQIITSTKRDIRHQLDTLRRKENGERGSEAIQMVFDNQTRFSDLVGCQEQVEYMQTIIDLLLSRNEYEAHGITVPKGALLLGLPGVGKTFIARAMAGEIQEQFAQKKPDMRVGFMSLSAPELTSKPVSFIGSVFDAAEEYDVCVIFLDEVDAIAKKRFQNPCYSHFIELIKQMDGMEQRSNVFILAATNAPEFLDPAFIRAGRIDKKLEFTLPDKKARCELARRSIRRRCGAVVNLNSSGREQGTGEIRLHEEDERGLGETAAALAAITPGCTAGDVENIVNTAFILYDRERNPQGETQPRKPLGEKERTFSGSEEWSYLYRSLYEAVERNNIGDPRSVGEETFHVDQNNESRSSTAVHEVGHALVNILCGCEPFEKITSLPRGSALGYVMPSRRKTLTRADCENRIRCAMGGRLAEEIVYGRENISWGASSDIQSATNLARAMVERLGFSEEFEFMALQEDTARYLGGSGYSCSDAFREESDRAVQALLKRLYQETRGMLADKRELIITLAGEVFRRETMTGREFIELYRQSLKG